MEAPAFAAPVAAVAAGVAYSRISTGVHYPSDVAVGAVIGAAIASGSAKVWPTVDLEPADARPVFSRTNTEPLPTGDGLVLVVNAASGPTAHQDDLARLVGAFPDMTVRLVDDPTNLDAVLAHVASSAVALGVLGGDGSVGAAAQAALEANVPLAVFPGGTLNHFARDLGVDTIDQAVSAIRDGQLVEVDALTIDGRVFLNTASFGSYADFVEVREDHEPAVGKWPAGVFALLKVMFESEPFEVKINGATQRIWTIFIGNCAYDPPGFVPATRARLDDGVFDVRIVDGTRSWARLRLFSALVAGRLPFSKVYTRKLVSELRIELPGATSMLAADGEIFNGDSSFVVKKAPARLRTFAPHT